MKALVVVNSIHHNNTEKIAKIFAEVLDATVKNPRNLDHSKLCNYNLIGFGSGIYSDKHHKALLNFADNLLPVTNKKAFIFSTSGSPGRFAKEFFKYTNECHQLLRGKLQIKGYTIVDEFSCPGFNTNSFLRFIGGINKGRPNTEDLKKAEQFALSLKQHMKSNDN